MALRFIEIREIHLQFVAGSSAKEYRVSLDTETLTVLTSWGRIGNVVNSQIHAFATVAEAQDFAVATVTKKINKGYRVVAERRANGGLVAR